MVQPPHQKSRRQKLDLAMPARYVKGVGPVRAEAFERLGVKTLGDLLEYFPRDWVFVPEAIKINHIRPGRDVTVAGLVESIDFQSYRHQWFPNAKKSVWGPKPIFEAYIADETGTCRIIWFHGGFLRDKLRCGQVIMASGRVSEYKHQLQLTNPKFVILDENQPADAADFGGPVYPATAKLSSKRIKQIVNPLLDVIDDVVDEFFDGPFRKKTNLISRPDAFRWIHSPPDEKKLAKAKRRLKYDELFLMQLGLALRRYKTRNFSSATAMKCTEEIDSRIRKRFPFLLTADQDQVINEILGDMAKTKPMNRLLQGDVGSGKTVVALYAALLAVANKTQAVIMAPTEILAGQHFVSIERFLKNSGVKRTLITGGLIGKKRAELLKQINSGQIDIIVGTVALLGEDIQFHRLGAAIIDEQHKFGVHQRA